MKKTDNKDLKSVRGGFEREKDADEKDLAKKEAETKGGKKEERPGKDVAKEAPRGEW